MEVCFDDTTDSILIIKDHKLFCNVVMQINKYTLSDEKNELVFIDGYNELIKSKNVVFISDFISYDLITRQLLNRIYLNMKNSIINDGEKDEVIQAALNSINSLVIEELDDYNVDFSYDFNIKLEDYFKLLNIKFNNSYNSLFSKIIDFIELYSELYYDKCVVITNLLSCLSDEEINEILKYKKYKKMNILFVENYFERSVVFNKYVIDNDFYSYKE